MVSEFHFDTVDIAGVPTALLSRSETTAAFIAAVEARRNGALPQPVLSSSMNGQTIYEIARNPSLGELFQRFWFMAMDGQPAVSISRRWPKSFPERVATTDLIHDVVAAGVGARVRHFLFGAKAEVVEQAAARLRESHPGCIIAGTHHGYVSDQGLAEVAAQIRSSGAEVVWVCMGVPREQHVALRLAEMLRDDLAVIKTGGGVLDFVSGARARAPQLMQDVGLEWLFRLLLEPRRLFVRYAVSNPIALMKLVSMRPQYRKATLSTDAA